jgi:hypothetical protein
MTLSTAPITDLGSAAAAVVDQVEQKRGREVIADGVYFGLNEALYHADPALGSGDIKRLAYSPADYWFNSPLNPLKEQEDTVKPAFIFGRAVHTNVLEGREKFERMYAPCEHPGNIKAGKEERAFILGGGQIPLKRDDYDRIQQAGAMIRANPHLSDAFTGGQSEVSCFWTHEGIRKKCRLDYVKLRATVDLKSIRNSKSIGFAEACCRAISDHRYDVQVEHYRDGRAAMRAFLEAGNVSGHEAIDPAWLKALATTKDTAWVFVFWQAEGAPLTWACSLSPGNGILDVARATINKAEDAYRLYLDRFGPDLPWVLNEPVRELDLSDLPAWYGRT